MSKRELQTQKLYVEIIHLINNARQHVYQKINSELVLLYWNIGNAIKKETLKNKRAEYGKQIIESLSVQLTEEFGKGWSSQQLRHCLRSVETFPEKEILYALSREFNWTQIRTYVYIEDKLKQDCATHTAKMTLKAPFFSICKTLSLN